MKVLVASVCAFTVGIAASWALPWSRTELVAAGVLRADRAPRPTAPPPPPDILAGLRAIAHAEECFRARTQTLGVDCYGSLDNLAVAGLVSPGIASGSLGGHRVEVEARPGIPGPIWVARIGKWTANQSGLLFEIPCRTDDPRFPLGLWFGCW